MKRILAEVTWFDANFFGGGTNLTRIKECEILEEKEKIIKVSYQADCWMREQWINRDKIFEILE